VTRARRPSLPTPRKKAGYHHEHLRRALLDAAIVHLRDGDVTGLTMQQLARAAGVSPGAPYHHFPDKVSLLAALATEGFELWLGRAQQATAPTAAPPARLAALASAWLDFAAACPSHYRVMFLPEVGDRRRFAALHETSARGLELLVGVLAEAQPGTSRPELLGRAVAAWATVHGLASLRAAGVLANLPQAPSVPSLERAAVEQVVASALRAPTST
jgi:AcrR family transcriptional regulator